MKLFPAIVTLHLIGGLVLLALLCAAGRAPDAAHQGVAPWRCQAACAGCWLARWRWWRCKACLAAGSVPTMRCWPAPPSAVPGQLVARDGLQRGLQIWRELGHLQDGSLIGFAALTAIHYVATAWRPMALLVLALLGGVCCAPIAARPGRWLGAWRLAVAHRPVQRDPGLAAGGGGAAHLRAAALVVVLTWALVASARPRPRPGHLHPAAGPRRGFLA